MLGTVVAADLFGHARRMGASDLHLTSDAPPVFRVEGTLQRFGDAPLPEREMQALCEILLSLAARRRLQRRGEVDVAFTADRLGRLRIHAYKAQGKIHFAVRFLAPEIPTFESLELPPAFRPMLNVSHGLLLIAGATGSGKTTVLAACIDTVNRSSARHILSIEDPIEYRHRALRSHINQREVGTDVPSFCAGIHGALRSDADVLAIGEIRTLDALSAALQAAETGHLVFATVHGDNAVAALERLLDSPAVAQPAIRNQIASTLRAVLAVKLIPTKQNKRKLLCELLVAHDAVRTLIREQKTHQLLNVIATGSSYGMQSFATSQAELAARGEIETAHLL